MTVHKCAQMCRMLACLTADGISESLITDFRRLSHDGKVPPRAAPGHTSGWGAFASDFGSSTLHYRSSRDASDDPSFDAVRRAMANLSGPKSIMIHLRKASIGKPQSSNSHPFVIDGRAFMHNGSIRGLSKIFSASRKPLGQTDSEKFFLLLLDSLEGRGMSEALAVTIPRLEALDYSSLTFVMQDGHSMYAYRHFSRYEDYYTLYYSKSGRSIVFSSERLPGLEWNLIGNRELVRACLEAERPVIERDSVAVRIS
jgi:predicted glutamine amidotransferase